MPPMWRRASCAVFVQGTTAGKWFEAYQESDGTLRVAGIITALLQEPPVPVIAIEEPELTVHPGAIPLVADFLIQASRRSQVLVTTHSPELLDCVDASAVRVVSRSPERGTMVSPMSATQGEAVRRGLLSLGEVLRLEGFQTEFQYPPDDDPGPAAADDDSDGGRGWRNRVTGPDRSVAPRRAASRPAC